MNQASLEFNSLAATIIGGSELGKDNFKLNLFPKAEESKSGEPGVPQEFDTDYEANIVNFDLTENKEKQK